MLLLYPASESDILFIGPLHPCHIQPLSLISYLLDLYTLVISPSSESDILFIGPLCLVIPSL